MYISLKHSLLFFMVWICFWNEFTCSTVPEFDLSDPHEAEQEQEGASQMNQGASMYNYDDPKLKGAFLDKATFDKIKSYEELKLQKQREKEKKEMALPFYKRKPKKKKRGNASPSEGTLVNETTQKEVETATKEEEKEQVKKESALVKTFHQVQQGTERVSRTLRKKTSSFSPTALRSRLSRSKSKDPSISKQATIQSALPSPSSPSSPSSPTSSLPEPTLKEDTSTSPSLQSSPFSASVKRRLSPNRIQRPVKPPPPPPPSRLASPMEESSQLKRPAYLHSFSHPVSKLSTLSPTSPSPSSSSSGSFSDPDAYITAESSMESNEFQSLPGSRESSPHRLVPVRRAPPVPSVQPYRRATSMK